MTPAWLCTVTGVLVLFVGFIFHWVGQLVSVLNWGLATKLGLQEKVMLPEHKAYEHGTAVVDVIVGPVYGLAGVGLLLRLDWAFKLVWVPGAILVYHGLSAWFWEMNRRRAGHPYFTDVRLAVWCCANILTGLLAMFTAWCGP